MFRGIAAFAFAGFLSVGTGCATTQQQQQQQQQNEESENQGNEQGNDVNASFNQQGNNLGNGGQEDFANSQNGANDFENGNNANLMEDGGGENGEFVNNADSEATFDQGSENMLANNGGMNNGAMMEEGAEGQDFGANINNATEMENFGAMNAQAINPAIPVEQPVVDASVNGVVDQTFDTMAPAAADPMAGAMPGAGVVRYVLEGGTQLFSDQDRTNVIKNLEQGDHPLVVENGEWARTSDGYYVSASGLTPRPIGRFKAPAEWQ